MSIEENIPEGPKFSSIPPIPEVSESFNADSIFQEREDNESKINNAFLAGVNFLKIASGSGEDKDNDIGTITHMVGNESYSAKLDENGEISEIYYLEVVKKNRSSEPLIFRCIILGPKMAVYVGANSREELLTELDKMSVISEGKQSGIYSNGKHMPRNHIALPSEIDALAKKFKDRGEEIELKRKRKQVLEEEGLS